MASTPRGKSLFTDNVSARTRSGGKPAPRPSTPSASTCPRPARTPSPDSEDSTDIEIPMRQTHGQPKRRFYLPGVGWQDEMREERDASVEEEEREARRGQHVSLLARAPRDNQSRDNHAGGFSLRDETIAHPTTRIATEGLGGMVSPPVNSQSGASGEAMRNTTQPPSSAVLQSAMNQSPVPNLTRMDSGSNDHCGPNPVAAGAAEKLIVSLRPTTGVQNKQMARSIRYIGPAPPADGSESELSSIGDTPSPVKRIVPATKTRPHGPSKLNLSHDSQRSVDSDSASDVKTTIPVIRNPARRTPAGREPTKTVQSAPRGRKPKKIPAQYAELFSPKTPLSTRIALAKEVLEPEVSAEPPTDLWGKKLPEEPEQIKQRHVWKMLLEEVTALAPATPAPTVHHTPLFAPERSDWSSERTTQRQDWIDARTTFQRQRTSPERATQRPVSIRERTTTAKPQGRKFNLNLASAQWTSEDDELYGDK